MTIKAAHSAGFPKIFPAFSGVASCTKGGRTYVQGGDILHEAEEHVSALGGLIESASFHTPLLVPGILQLHDEAPPEHENARVTGHVKIGGQSKQFSIIDSDTALGPDRPYDVSHPDAGCVR